TSLRPEWHGCEKRKRGILAGPVARCRPGRLDRARRHGIEGLERRNDGARLLEGYGDLAPRSRCEAFLDDLAKRTELRQRARIGRLHIPFDFVERSRRAGRNKAERGRYGQGRHQRFRMLSSLGRTAVPRPETQGSRSL